MVECQLNSKCKVGVLDYVEEDMEIGKMDWCGYIVSRIKECKKKWRSGDLNSHFQGALTILMLLYVDGCTCEGINERRAMSPVRFWTYENLLLREELEILKGGFGLGYMRTLNVEGSDEDNLDISRGDDESDYSGDILDRPGLPSTISKLRTKFQWMVIEKPRFEKLLLDVVSDYPGNVDVQEIVENYKRLFNRRCGKR